MPKNISGTDAKKARETAKLSQAAVAAAVGLNRTYYSLYESGHLTLTDSQNSALVELLHTHNAGALLSTQPANTQPMPPVEAEYHELRANTDGRVIQSANIAHSVRHSPNARRMQIFIQRLIALEQTVAIEQTTGRRTSFPIERALASLQMLNYCDLYKLSVRHRISL